MDASALPIALVNILPPLGAIPLPGRVGVPPADLGILPKSSHSERAEVIRRPLLFRAFRVFRGYSLPLRAQPHVAILQFVLLRKDFPSELRRPLRIPLEAEACDSEALARGPWRQRGQTPRCNGGNWMLEAESPRRPCDPAIAGGANQKLVRLSARSASLGGAPRRNPKLRTRNPGTRNPGTPKPRNPKPETRNPKPETTLHPPAAPAGRRRPAAARPPDPDPTRPDPTETETGTETEPNEPRPKPGKPETLALAPHESI